MIPAPRRLFAFYRYTAKASGPLATTRKETVGDQSITLEPGEYLRAAYEVLAFNDDGEPYVLSKGTLVRANELPGFVGVGQTARDDAPIVQMIPAIDWVVWRVDQGGPWSNRVVAWGLTSDGAVVALEADGNGLVENADLRGPLFRRRPTH